MSSYEAAMFQKGAKNFHLCRQISNDIKEHKVCKCMSVDPLGAIKCYCSELKEKMLPSQVMTLCYKETSTCQGFKERENNNGTK